MLFEPLFTPGTPLMCARSYSSSLPHGFAWVHSSVPRVRRVHSGSRRFILSRLGVVGFIRVRVASIGRSRCRRVYSGSRGFSRTRPVVIRFIRVRVGSLRRAKGSSGKFGFAYVHSCASCLVEFIRDLVRSVGSA